MSWLKGFWYGFKDAFVCRLGPEDFGWVLARSIIFLVATYAAISFVIVVGVGVIALVRAVLGLFT